MSISLLTIPPQLLNIPYKSIIINCVDIENNTYLPKFTFIIPFRYRQDRIIHLRRVIEFLNGFNGTSVMVIEQDKHSKLAHLNLRCNHYFVENSVPFNKSWAFNIALKRVISPYVIFMDADFLMDPNELINCMKEADNYDCVLPTSTVTKLNFIESNTDTRTLLSIKRPENKKSMLDHIAIFKRESLINIAGWNEDFFGGNEDNIFQEKKVKKLLKWKQFEYDGKHLIHGAPEVDLGLLNRNKELIEAIDKQPDSFLVQHIHDVVSKVGKLNRFQS
jgi:glycosyltransferase involved in cell wall biosynthesis